MTRRRRPWAARGGTRPTGDGWGFATPSQWWRHTSWTTVAMKSPAIVQPDDPINDDEDNGNVNDNNNKDETGGSES